MAFRFFNPRYNLQYTDWSQKKPVETLAKVAMMEAKADALAPYAKKFFVDASAMATTFKAQQENFDGLLSEYEERVNNVSDMIINASNPADRLKAVNEMINLKRDFTSNATKGNISKYTNSYAQFQKALEENKDHPLKDKFIRAVQSQVARPANPDDPESGFHHLAHAICCSLFKLERDLTGE